MMTFVAVVLGVLVANVIWAVGVFALMGSKKVQKWMIGYYFKYMEKYCKVLEEKFEDEELA